MAGGEDLSAPRSSRAARRVSRESDRGETPREWIWTALKFFMDVFISTYSCLLNCGEVEVIMYRYTLRRSIKDTA